jgi:hypothetical protein
MRSFTLILLPDIRVVKSKRMRSAGYMIRKGEKRNAHRVLVGKVEGR